MASADSSLHDSAHGSLSVGWGSSTTYSSSAGAGAGQSPQSDPASRGDSDHRSPEAHASPSGARGSSDRGESRSSLGQSAPGSGDGRSHGPLMRGPRWVHGSPANDSEGGPAGPPGVSERLTRVRSDQPRPTAPDELSVGGCPHDEPDGEHAGDEADEGRSALRALPADRGREVVDDGQSDGHIGEP